MDLGLLRASSVTNNGESIALDTKRAVVAEVDDVGLLFWALSSVTNNGEGGVFCCSVFAQQGFIIITFWEKNPSLVGTRADATIRKNETHAFILIGYVNLGVA